MHFLMLMLMLMLMLLHLQVEDECGDIPMVLVQNKIDLISQSEIDQWVKCTTIKVTKQMTMIWWQQQSTQFRLGKQRCDENICYSATTMWYLMICQCWSIFSQIRSRAPRLGMQHEALPNLCKGDKRDNRGNCDYTLSMMVSHISRMRVSHPKPPVGTEILGVKEKTVNKHYSCSKGGSQCGCRVPTPGWKLRQQGWTNSCEYLDDNDKISYWCATQTPHHHLLPRWEARTPSTQASTAFPSGEHPLAAAVKGLSQNHHHHIIPRLHIIISS